MNQFSRFIMVGVLNTLLGYSIIFVCMYLAKMTPETSNVSGYVVGLIVSYILNRNFTFKSKQDRRGEILRFLVVFIISYVSNFVVLIILIHGIGLHKGVSQVFAGVVYVLASYLMNKYFVFKSVVC
jgi:putative flippase GtrA